MPRTPPKPSRLRSTPAVHRSSSIARRKILLAGIDARRAEFRKDPTGLYALVESTLLPHFDTPYAAQLVLGQHWRNATPEQRKRFVDAFYKSLLYTYGDAMVDFTGDRLKVLPTKVAPTDERATVRTEIKRSNGTKVGVNYSLRKVKGEWKAWDVVIDGISYVKSYREDYGAEVQQKGLDAVITRLEAKAQERQVRQGENDLKHRHLNGQPLNVRVGISESAAGRIAVTGELTFATARDARQLGVLVLESSRADRSSSSTAAASRAPTARDSRCCSTGSRGAVASRARSRSRICRRRWWRSRGSAKSTGCSPRPADHDAGATPARRVHQHLRPDLCACRSRRTKPC